MSEEDSLACAGCGATNFTVHFDHDGDVWTECAVCGREVRELDDLGRR